MKYFTTTAIIVLATGMALTNHPAFAQERVKVYQMAESGMSIEFKMTLKEIAAEDVKNIQSDLSRKTNRNAPRKNVKLFEMGESGQFVAFSIPESEILAKGTENVNQRITLTPPPVHEKQETSLVTHELAESGINLEFPAQPPDKAAGDAIAEKFDLEDLKI